MSKQFIFVHGWGMGPDFWDGLINRLPGIEAHCIDLSFTGNAHFLSDFSSSAVYVTHSLGTMWALKNRAADMKALIAVNGFACFKNFADAKTLRAMKLRLKKDPDAQMKDFWTMCDLPASARLNVERLQEGLEWLEFWDTGAPLRALQCPVLSLAGRDDPILPLARMEREWAGFEMHVRDNAGHALPLTDGQWCANHIDAFCHDF